jgi:hypothetical protein
MRGRTQTSIWRLPCPPLITNELVDLTVLLSRRSLLERDLWLLVCLIQTSRTISLRLQLQVQSVLPEIVHSEAYQRISAEERLQFLSHHDIKPVERTSAI